jgi:hypothetical protein
MPRPRAFYTTAECQKENCKYRRECRKQVFSLPEVAQEVPAIPSLMIIIFNALNSIYNCGLAVGQVSVVRVSDELTF